MNSIISALLFGGSGGGGGSSSAEPYYITITGEIAYPAYQTNCTMSDIVAAYDAGKRLRLIMDIDGALGIADLQSLVNSDTAIFTVNAPNDNCIYTAFVYDSGDTYAQAYLYIVNTNSAGFGDEYHVTVARDDDEQCWMVHPVWSDILQAYKAGYRIIADIYLYDDSSSPEVYADLASYNVEYTDYGQMIFFFTIGQANKSYCLTIDSGGPHGDVYGFISEISMTDITTGGIVI